MQSTPEHFSTHISDTSWLLRMDNACMFVCYMDFFDPTNENFLLQQLFGRSSFVCLVHMSHVLSSCEVSLLLTSHNFRFVIQLFLQFHIQCLSCYTSYNSNIIQYQDNLTKSPPICELYKMFDFNTTDTARFMNENCRESPTFTAGNKNVSWISPNYWEPISWKLIDSSAVLGLSHSDFVDFPTRLAHSLLQTVFHESKISFDGASYAQLDFFNISCKSATLLLHRWLSIATVWKYLYARVASIHRNRFCHRTETNNVYHRNSSARWLDAWASWENFQVFPANGEIKA